VLIVPPVVVTVTLTPTEPPWLSVTTIVQTPAATEVTVNVALGPFPPAGLNVAIPAHALGAKLAAPSVPV
jgi:hypothetical protein